MGRRSAKVACAGLIATAAMMVPASVSAGGSTGTTYSNTNNPTNTNGAAYYNTNNYRTTNGRTYYVDDNNGMTYVVNGQTYYVTTQNDPIANGLWTGVNAATVGPPANSVNSQIRQACGLPNATFELGGQRYQDIIGNGLMTGVNVATTWNNRQPGTPGCTVSVTPARNGRPAQVTVRTNPSTTANPYVVRVVTPSATTTRVYTPTTTTTTPDTTYTTTPTTTYTQDSYPTTTTTTNNSPTTYKVFVDPWDASIDWTPVTTTTTRTFN